MPLTPLRKAALACFAATAVGAVAFGWGAAAVIEDRLARRVSTALEAAGADWAQIEADGWTVAVTGRAPDAEAAQTALTAARRAAGGAALRDGIEIAEADRAGAPPAIGLDILIDATGATVMGTAPDEATRDALLADLARATGLEVLDLTDTSYVEPSAAWTAGARAAAAAAGALSHGRIALSPRALSIAGLPDGDPALGPAKEAIARFAESGGDVTLDLLDSEPIAAIAPPPAEDLQPTTAGRTPRRPARPDALWLRARLTDDLVTLTGATPDEATRNAVRSFAAAAFGAQTVHDGLAIAAAPAPAGWRAAALAGLDALAQLERGRLEVVDGRIDVAGASAETGAVRAVAMALDAVSGAAWRTASRVTVDLPARAAALRIPPAECAAQMTQIAAADPILFAPGDSTIEAGSEDVLNALASLLPRCAESTEIEVGGHTDSQGSEGYNMRLSTARAAAVRDALIERGAPPFKLTARGYGENQPIADNDTEEGRARNRRIAFTSPGAAGGDAADEGGQE
jgi:OOP family OmpA-OmpF porin